LELETAQKPSCPAFRPGIHVLAAATKNVDGRDICTKTRFALLPGHDDW
jgi:hypothetical protein